MMCSAAAELPNQRSTFVSYNAFRHCGHILRFSRVTQCLNRLGLCAFISELALCRPFASTKVTNWVQNAQMFSVADWGWKATGCTMHLPSGLVLHAFATGCR